MRDKPCQKGNQPCCCSASLSNLLFSFITRYAGLGCYTNTHTYLWLMTLFNILCIFIYEHTWYIWVDVACLILHCFTSKPISQYHLSLPVIKYTRSGVSLLWSMKELEILKVKCHKWVTHIPMKISGFDQLRDWFIELLSPYANWMMDPHLCWHGVQDSSPTERKSHV